MSSRFGRHHAGWSAPTPPPLRAPAGRLLLRQRHGSHLRHAAGAVRQRRPHRGQQRRLRCVCPPWAGLPVCRGSTGPRARGGTSLCGGVEMWQAGSTPPYAAPPIAPPRPRRRHVCADEGLPALQVRRRHRLCAHRRPGGGRGGHHAQVRCCGQGCQLRGRVGGAVESALSVQNGGKTGVRRSPACCASFQIASDVPNFSLPPRRTKVIYTESISNPTLVVADIPGLADIARRHVSRGPCASGSLTDAAGLLALGAAAQLRPRCTLSCVLPGQSNISSHLANSCRASSWLWTTPFRRWCCRPSGGRLQRAFCAPCSAPACSTSRPEAQAACWDGPSCAWLTNTLLLLCGLCCRLGADVVVHSLTKFISGASGVLGGTPPPAGDGIRVCRPATSLL